MQLGAAIVNGKGSSHTFYVKLLSYKRYNTHTEYVISGWSDHVKDKHVLVRDAFLHGCGVANLGK